MMCLVAQRQRRVVLGLGVALAMVASVCAGPALAWQDTGDKAHKAPEKSQAPPLYDESADAAKDIAAAVARANRENRRVLIQWGANWCGWCKLLNEKFTGDATLSRKLQYEYDVVHVDIGNWNKNLDLAQKYKADFQSKGVPYLTILDGAGNVLVNHETGSFETGDSDKPGHDADKLMDFLTKYQAAYLPAESILSDALLNAKKTDRNLFVHFGAPWCPWCHKLEDWMDTKPVAKLLGTDFVNVKIDVDRTVGGQEMLTQYRKSEKGGIPWFVLLDADGKVLANSNDENGNNIGCPWTEQEIATFRKTIAKATKRLTDEQLDELVKTMGPQEGKK